MTMHYDPLAHRTASSVQRVIRLGRGQLLPPLSPQDSSTPTVHGLYRAGLKRLFDIGVILLFAPIVVVLIGVLAMGVAVDRSNPFYYQDRVGRGGRIYRMWKLRSMIPGADEALEVYLSQHPAARMEWDTTQKLKADPRITRFGRLLRKSSLDELPQLWNVLMGHMSLVGPRPMMPNQQTLYPGTAYYALRPGITGPWQVSRRNESSFAERAHFDLAYDQSLSLATDLRLLVRTIRVVLRATGY